MRERVSLSAGEGDRSEDTRHACRPTRRRFAPSDQVKPSTHYRETGSSETCQKVNIAVVREWGF